MKAIYEMRIDLIDLANGSLIATRRHDALFEAFIGNGLVIETVENERDFPEMVVWRLGFAEPR
ncbi:MAG: hypothetical protein F4020_09755 [Gammaproteobacteria bacterium]|nr:hypothetical protein [Gammaproteobacteria bacterium]